MRYSLSPYCALVMLAVVAGCSSSPTDTQARRSVDREPGAHDYPAGAAAVLSVVGSGAEVPETSASPWQAATNCVVALRTVRTLVGRLPQRPDAQQMAVLDRAEQIYADRARAAADAPAAAASDIEQQLQAAEAAPSAQARLALACVKDLS